LGIGHWALGIGDCQRYFNAIICRIRKIGFPGDQFSLDVFICVDNAGLPLGNEFRFDAPVFLILLFKKT
jgi:hypothetical protein